MTLERIVAALERMVEQSDEAIALHREAYATRAKADSDTLRYWEANEARLAEADSRAAMRALVDRLAESVDRAKNIAAAREYLRLVDEQDAQP